jgi:hypothetical protein
VNSSPTIRTCDTFPSVTCSVNALYGTVACEVALGRNDQTFHTIKIKKDDPPEWMTAMGCGRPFSPCEHSPAAVPHVMATAVGHDDGHHHQLGIDADDGLQQQKNGGNSRDHRLLHLGGRAFAGCRACAEDNHTKAAAIDPRPMNTISGNALAVFGMCRRCCARRCQSARRPSCQPRRRTLLATGVVWIAAVRPISLCSGVAATIGAVFNSSPLATSTEIA